MPVTYTTTPSSGSDQNVVIPTDDQINNGPSNNQDRVVNGLSNMGNNLSSLNPFLQSVYNGDVNAVLNNTLSSNLMSQSDNTYVDINTLPFNFTALQIAVYRKDPAMVQALIDNASTLLNNGNPYNSQASSDFKNFIDFRDYNGYTAFNICCLVVSDATVTKTDNNANTNVSIWYILSNLYPDLYSPDLNGTYPLMNMIINGKLNLFENTLNNNKLINQGKIDNQLSYSAISNACANPTDQMLNCAINQGVNVNAIDPNSGKIPLIDAVQADKLDIVNTFLEYKAEPTMEDGDGNTAAYYAFTSNNANSLSIVQALVKNHEDNHKNDANYQDLRCWQDSLGRNAFHYIASPGVSSSSELLDYIMSIISQVPDNPLNAVNDLGKTPLYVAIENNPSLIGLYLQQGANVNCIVDSTGMTPLLLAAQNGNLANLKIFLNQDPGCQIATPADATASEKVEDATALHFVARNMLKRDSDTLIDMATYLLNAGALINAQLSSGDFKGNTPLNECACNDDGSSSNQYNLAKFLVEQGAQDIVNRAGQHFYNLAPQDQQQKYIDLAGQMHSQD